MDEENVEFVEEPTKPVVPKKRRESMPKRMMSLLVGTIDFNAIGDSILKEVIIPRIEDMIYTSIESTARQIFLRGPTSSTGGTVSNKRGTSGYDYNAISKRSTSAANRAGGYQVKNVTFNTRHEAKTVLDIMRNYSKEYSFVTVATFYEECGLDVRPEDYKFGWRTIDSGAYISGDSSGLFTLYMPTPVKK